MNPIIQALVRPRSPQLAAQGGGGRVGACQNIQVEPVALRRSVQPGGQNDGNEIAEALVQVELDAALRQQLQQQDASSNQNFDVVQGRDFRDDTEQSNQLTVQDAHQGLTEANQVAQILEEYTDRLFQKNDKVRLDLKGFKLFDSDVPDLDELEEKAIIKLGELDKPDKEIVVDVKNFHPNGLLNNSALNEPENLEIIRFGNLVIHEATISFEDKSFIEISGKQKPLFCRKLEFSLSDKFINKEVIIRFDELEIHEAVIIFTDKSFFVIGGKQNSGDSLVESLTVFNSNGNITLNHLATNESPSEDRDANRLPTKSITEAEADQTLTNPVLTENFDVIREDQFELAEADFEKIKENFTKLIQSSNPNVNNPVSAEYQIVTQSSTEVNATETSKITSLNQIDNSLGHENLPFTVTRVEFSGGFYDLIIHSATNISNFVCVFLNRSDLVSEYLNYYYFNPNHIIAIEFENGQVKEAEMVYDEGEFIIYSSDFCSINNSEGTPCLVIFTRSNNAVTLILGNGDYTELTNAQVKWSVEHEYAFNTLQELKAILRPFKSITNNADILETQICDNPNFLESSEYISRLLVKYEQFKALTEVNLGARSLIVYPIINFLELINIDSLVKDSRESNYLPIFLNNQYENLFLVDFIIKDFLENISTSIERLIVKLPIQLLELFAGKYAIQMLLTISNLILPLLNPKPELKVDFIHRDNKIVDGIDVGLVLKDLDLVSMGKSKELVGFFSSQLQTKRKSFKPLDNSLINRFDSRVVDQFLSINRIGYESLENGLVNKVETLFDGCAYFSKSSNDEFRIKVKSLEGDLLEIKRCMKELPQEFKYNGKDLREYTCEECYEIIESLKNNQTEKVLNHVDLNSELKGLRVFENFNKSIGLKTKFLHDFNELKTFLKKENLNNQLKLKLLTVLKKNIGEKNASRK